MNYENYIYQQPIDPARQAILLAMTQSMEQEKEMIRELQGMGVKCVATMAAGFNFDISPKLINNLVGACLNANIIEKKKAHIHPVVHALHEAMKEFAALYYCGHRLWRCAHFYSACNSVRGLTNFLRPFQ